MNYGNIKRNDIANGTGVRISLFVSGCTHHCKGCFQPETWNFNYGKPFTRDTEDEIISLLSPTYVDGLTILGGEPMEKQNQSALLPFIKRVRETYPEKSIWCYTGYTLEADLQSGGRAHYRETDELLSLLDVLVDGEFMEAEKDITLSFRGSKNQRLIDMNKTRQSGQTVLLPLK